MRRGRSLIQVLLGATLVALSASAAEVPELFKAAGAGDQDTVERLLAAGADPEGRVPSGATALIVAAQNGYDPIVVVLIAAGADGNAVTSGEAAQAGRTALHFAAQNGHQEVVATLLAQEVSVDARTGQGFTPLHLAAESGHAATARVLIGAGADIEARNQSGATPLISAIMDGQDETAIALLELGANVDVPTDNGISALMMASYLGNERVVEALLGRGADTNYTDGDKNTALDFATMEQHSIVRYRLLDAGATAKRTGLEFGEDLMAGKVSAQTDKSITVVAPEGTRTFLIGPTTKLCAGGRETSDLARITGAETVSVFTGMNERTARRIDDQGFTMKLKGQEWVTVMPDCAAGE